MIAFVRTVLRGTGPLTWLVYLAALGGLLLLVAPDGFDGLAAVLAGVLATARVELNSYRARIERLEALAAHPGLKAEGGAAVGGRVALGGV